jgi:hypothetical protein
MGYYNTLLVREFILSAMVLLFCGAMGVIAIVAVC